MSSHWPHLNKAPIVEALIDIRSELPEAVDLKTLASIHERIRDTYPKKNLVAEWHQEIQLGSAESPPQAKEPTGGPKGHRFDSADGIQVIQARLDGFTFSRLKPYIKWNHLIEESKRYWRVFCEIAGVLKVVRLATRFINRIPLAMPVNELGDWFVTRPELAASLGFPLSDYFLRLVITFSDQNTKAIINQKPESGDGSKSVSLLFDIDVFRMVSLDPGSDQIWKTLEELRAIKNRIFFESLTPQTVQLFDPVKPEGKDSHGSIG
ncbi:MAG: TIGR04255 family protein [Planctomycetes bacterium]|nr:TIGR04255 family protein [Planctomycetota bacterium]